MHTTGRAATKRLNLAEMEDLVRLAHTAHTLTPDLITDTVVDHVGALVRELAHHRLLEMGMHNPPTCPNAAIARTTADDALAGFRRDERSLPNLSRPVEDCDRYLALAEVRHLRLDDPRGFVQIYLAICLPSHSARRDP